jgi:hypothetical protein
LRIILLVIVFIALTLSLAEAHRSGCHRWHSCPSDSGSYTCGDTGRCSGCSDNQYCESGSPRLRKVAPPKPPAKPAKPQKKELPPESDLWEVPLQFKQNDPKTTTDKTKFHESDYRDYICSKLGGETEHVLDEGSRVDCLTDANAIEVDWAKKWSEAIGQSLYYSTKTGKQAGIVLIISEPRERRHLEKIKQVAIANNLDIKLWTVHPEALVENQKP